jgi:hypothetical protein
MTAVIFPEMRNSTKKHDRFFSPQNKNRTRESEGSMLGVNWGFNSNFVRKSHSKVTTHTRLTDVKCSLTVAVMDLSRLVSFS